MIGNFDRLFLQGVRYEANGTIPAMLFMAFQGMFVIITPALIAALMLGPRQGYPEKISPPHNLPFAVLERGRQRGMVEVYRGHKEVGSLLRKVRIEVAATQPFVETTLEAIVNAARTGERGEDAIG